MTEEEEKQYLREGLARLTTHLNSLLKEAHQAGLSVSINANGFTQLQEGERLQVEIGLNECEHKWTKVSSIEQHVDDERKYNWHFERCDLCNQTRSVPDRRARRKTQTC